MQKIGMPDQQLTTLGQKLLLVKRVLAYGLLPDRFKKTLRVRFSHHCIAIESLRSCAEIGQTMAARKIDEGAALRFHVL